MATSSNVIIQYMYALRAQHDHSFAGICSPTTNDLADVMQFPALAREKKQQFSLVDIAYNYLSKQLTSLLKTHLAMENSKYHGTFSNNGKGTLNFKNLPLYLKAKTSTDVIISSTDESVQYEFLMLKSITGDKTTNLLADFSFNRASHAYTSVNSDLLDLFDYKDASGSAVDRYKDGKTNPDALAIFKQDRTEVESIIKNVFKNNSPDCNLLRNTDSYHQLILCNGASDSSHPDYFIQFMTCLETFNLVQIPNFCD